MRMNFERYSWCIGALVKFTLLGAPAVVALWVWRRRGLDCRKLYYVSWANICVYLLWAAAMSLMSVLTHYRAFLWLTFSALPAALAFFIPLLFSFGTLVLCFLSVIAKRNERLYVFLSNLLMLILWIVSVVAPN